MATPELSQLLALSRDRTAYQNPLFQAVTQMAYQGLPTYARQGTQLSGTLSNQAPPAPSGGGMNPALAAGLGGLAGAGLNGLGSNGSSLKALIDGLKKLFGHGGSGIQGNQPYGGGGITGGGQPSQYPFEGWAGNDGMNPAQWPGADPMPSVTTSEDYGIYGSGGVGDQGPYWDGGSQWGGGGMGDQGPQDDWWHP